MTLEDDDTIRIAVGKIKTSLLELIYLTSQLCSDLEGQEGIAPMSRRMMKYRCQKLGETYTQVEGIRV
jgi:hypothetical protein